MRKVYWLSVTFLILVKSGEDRRRREYDKLRQRNVTDPEPRPHMVNVEVRKNEEGYELKFKTLIYSELLMSNVSFLVSNQICRVLP